MDWREFPPLASLRAFEAAARTGSYSAAGRELNVSHAAVVQQVRALETFLGLRLAERAGRGIAVTADGALLADQLSRGFGQIASALTLLSQREQDRPVHITMSPNFAVSWFMPRMPLFRDAHPEIDLLINPTAENVDFTRSDVDAAIRFGYGGWQGLDSEPFLESSFVIVGAPALLESWSGRLEDLVTLPWIEEVGTAEIREWLTSHSIEMPPPARVTQMPRYMIPNAMRDGQGISATARAFVDDDLSAGRLIAVYEASEGLGYSYHLVYRRGVQRPALKALLRWLRAEACAP